MIRMNDIRIGIVNTDIVNDIVKSLFMKNIEGKLDLASSAILE
jgi:hypothetical protein